MARRKRAAKRALFILVVAGLAVVAVRSTARPSPEEVAIREAAYRHMFANNASGLQLKACAYYLGVCDGWSDDDDPGARSSWFVEKIRQLLISDDTSAPGDDPHPCILAPFRCHKPPVRPVSDCMLRDVMKGIEDRHTGSPGLVFITGRIRWISRGCVEVEGGYYEGGVSSSGNIYRLIKSHGRWIVVYGRLTWIS